MGNKVFTFGDIRIREVKGKYYVYIIEKGDDGQRRDHYIGSLDKVVEIALHEIGGVGVSPTMQAFRACDPGSNPGRGTVGGYSPLPMLTYISIIFSKGPM